MWWKAIIELITSGLGLGTKAIKPDEIRIRNNRIKEPLKIKRVEGKVHAIDIDMELEPWAAKIRTFDLKKRGKRKTVTQKELIQYVKEIIIWGAKIEDIRKTDTEVQLDYEWNGFCYPTEVYKL